MKEYLESLKGSAEKWRPEEVLRWAYSTFGGEVALASGFGVEGMALIDMASRLNPKLKIFTLDTEFLFPETYDLIDRVERRYSVKVERVYSSLTPEEQERAFGAALWSRTPDQCCHLRKVQPLTKKLAGMRAWITAIRRDQTRARAAARRVEWDARFQIVKINPIADWSAEMVWKYVRAHDVPYNSLHDRNYPSIGCTHCTQAVQPGEGSRTGRWSGFQKTECGLHAGSVPGATPLVSIEAMPGKES